MVSEMSITKKMLATLREGRVNQAKQASQVFVKEEKEEETTEKILTYYEIEGHYVAETTGSTLTPPEETGEEVGAIE